MADANQNRDWRIYHDLAQTLIQRARLLDAKDDFGLQLDQTIYALDSTTIDLCLNLFSWGAFAVPKPPSNCTLFWICVAPFPYLSRFPNGKMADVRVLDGLILEAGAFYVMDRAYVDFQRLHQFVSAGAFYVTRSKSNLQYRLLESRSVEAGTGIRSGLRRPA